MKSVLLLCAAMIIVPSSCYALSDDLSAMLSFIADWTPKDPSWTEAVPVCSWVGVKCSPNGTVTVFDVGNRAMTGTFNGSRLPANIKTLYLDYNRFTGTPILGGLLAALTFVDLSNNDFNGPLDLSGIPRSLWDYCLYVSSPTLILSRNQFCGSTNVSMPCACAVSDGKCNYTANILHFAPCNDGK